MYIMEYYSALKKRERMTYCHLQQRDGPGVYYIKITKTNSVCFDMHVEPKKFFNEYNI